MGHWDTVGTWTQEIGQFQWWLLSKNSYVSQVQAQPSPEQLSQLHHMIYQDIYQEK